MRPLFSLLLCLVSASALAGSADLDLDFGDGGRKLGEYGAAGDRFLPLLAVASSGSGYSALIARNTALDANVFLVRFDARGNEISAVDLGFFPLHFGGARWRPDGGFVTARVASGDDGKTLLIIEGLRSDGTLDAGFGGGDGRVEFEDPGAVLWPNAMDMNAQGEIAVTGFRRGETEPVEGWKTFVARVSADGVPVAAFGGDGLVVHDLIPNQQEGPAAVALLSTGAVLVCDRGLFGGQFDALLTRLRSSGVVDSFASGGTLYYDTSLPAGANREDSCADIDINPVGGAMVMTVLSSEAGNGAFARRVPVDHLGNAGAAFDNVVAPNIRGARLAFDAQGRSVLLVVSRRNDSFDLDLVRFGATGVGDISFGVGGQVRYAAPLPPGVDLGTLDVRQPVLLHDSRGRIVAGASLRRESADESGWTLLRLMGDLTFADGFE